MPTIDGEEVLISIPLKDMRKVFELADQIAQIKVKYHHDPLRMANAAINEMQDKACEIAAIVSSCQ